METREINELCLRVMQEMQKVIIGQEETIEYMLVALFSKGHVLLEGVPGTAKTLLAQTFSRCLRLEFKRIQFTPDLMPGDILGTNIYNFQKNEFTLLKGPIFTDVLLADEINRTPPKTQAALLQAMQERTVTLDSQTMSLGDDFIVIATQNPIEQQGTYPLPEAQLDRFLCKLKLGYPSREEEVNIVSRLSIYGGMPEIDELGVSPVLDGETIRGIRKTATGVLIKPEIIEYIIEIMRATREHAYILFGASTRSINMLAAAARALALIRGRDYVLPDDIKVLFKPVLRHRIVLSPSAEIDGVDPDIALDQILDTKEAPK